MFKKCINCKNRVLYFSFHNYDWNIQEKEQKPKPIRRSLFAEIPESDLESEEEVLSLDDDFQSLSEETDSYGEDMVIETDQNIEKNIEKCSSGKIKPSVWFNSCFIASDRVNDLSIMLEPLSNHEQYNLTSRRKHRTTHTTIVISS